MPNAVQTIAGFNTAAGAGLNIVTPAAGDSFVVPSFDFSSKAYIEQLWADGTTHDFIRFRSPRLHDNNQGMRIRAGGTPRRSLLPWGNKEVLFPSDAIIVEVDQTGAGSDVVVAQYAFDDLGGVAPRLATWEDVQPRILHIMGDDVSLTSGAIGTWGAGVALNAGFDNFEAGEDYAWLGYTIQGASSAIAMTGKDTGNLKIGGPANDDQFESTNYFVNWAQLTGKARIPIIAANNRASTVVQNISFGAAASTHVTLYLAQLA